MFINDLGILCFDLDQESDKLKDDDLYKFLADLKRPSSVLKRLKCIPGNAVEVMWLSILLGVSEKSQCHYLQSTAAYKVSNNVNVFESFEMSLELFRHLWIWWGLWCSDLKIVCRYIKGGWQFYFYFFLQRNLEAWHLPTWGQTTILLNFWVTSGIVILVHWFNSQDLIVDSPF